MTDLSEAQRIDRGRRANEALETFLTPAFDFVRGQYLNRMKRVISEEPWNTDKIVALTMAQRVVEEVQKEIMIIVRDGDQVKRDMIRIEELTSMTAARRKALGI